jgi:hypothetical protein
MKFLNFILNCYQHLDNNFQKKFHHNKFETFINYYIFFGYIVSLITNLLIYRNDFSSFLEWFVFSSVISIILIFLPVVVPIGFVLLILTPFVIFDEIYDFWKKLLYNIKNLILIWKNS